MGFRLIRNDSEEYKNKLAQLKHEQLTEQTHIWTNLIHNKDKVNAFIARFLEVQKKSEKKDPAQGIIQLGQNIKSSKANLVTLQGNVDLADLYDLLDQV